MSYLPLELLSSGARLRWILTMHVEIIFDILLSAVMTLFVFMGRSLV